MTTYVQDPVTLELIPKEKYYREPVAHYIIPDISPYKSMQTGEMIQGRAQHREHIYRHNLVEIGNEIKHHLKPRETKVDRAGIRRDLINALR
jgi:hypothetical protein